MPSRMRMSRRSSKRQFRKGVKKQHSKNRGGSGSYWQRGGIRL